ncbi:MAG: cobalamin B12-binding domain-containing protein [Marmoricola sp.]
MDRLWTAVLEHRPGAAVGVVEELLEAGTPALDVLDAVAGVQREVGDRWERGTWTVTQEHRATGIAALAVEAVDRHVRRTPITRGRVVVACSEREWHGLAQSLITTALRTDGWQVTALGPSSSLHRFGRTLHDLDPDATALSCSLLRSLPSARSFIRASTEVGVPLLAGGAAFGADASRALRMGATLWAADARSAVDQLGGDLVAPRPAPPVPGAALHEWATLDRTQRAHAETLRTGWVATGAAPEAVLAGAVVDEVLGAVLAALVSGDSTVLAQALTWCRRILSTRGHRSDLEALGRMMAAELRDYPVALHIVTGSWS